jgi:hypothetical protein
MGGWVNLAAAVALCDRVIEIETAALGADHLETATTLQAKADALVQMGGSANFAAAIALYDCVVRIETAALGSDHLETATALSAKALVQMGGSANLAAAEALYDRVIDIETRRSRHLERRSPAFGVSVSARRYSERTY